MATSRLAQARDAVRPALKARLMISGPTGAGKTWTALKIAEVLAEGGKILVIDTEKESALTYADNFSFVHLPWLPPFEPRELARTMAEAGHEYAVVIVDSTSHFWRKEGGTLDIAGGKFTGWKDARPAQEDLVQALLDCHAHVILCTRSKMEHVQEEINGRHVVRKVGMAPQQDDDLEYELNISIEMDMDHRATVAKSRADAVQVGRSFTAGHEVELAALYADWLKGGEPPAPQPVVDDLVARMNALPPAVRPVCKREFVQAFGRPDGLRECRAPEAEALVARFEAVESHSLPVEEPTTPTASAHGAGDGDDKGTDDGTLTSVGASLTVPEDESTLKATNEAAYTKLNRYCRKVAADHFDPDKDTKAAQWEALAYACSAGRTVHLGELTPDEASDFRRRCQDVANGLARWVESDRPEHLGWTFDLTALDKEEVA